MSEINREEGKPPSRRMKRYWKVAVLANIKDDNQPKPEGGSRSDFRHSEQTPNRY